MSRYVVSKGGTFGTEKRIYIDENGVPILIIKWGPLAWLTPVLEKDVKYLSSPYEAEARQEALEWLSTMEER